MRFPENLNQLPLLLVQPQTHQCKFLIHRYRNLHVKSSPAKREHSIQKRQRPTKVNTVLTTAGVYSGNKITTLTDDQKALDSETERNPQHGQIWCGGGGRQTAIATCSLDTLGVETSTGRILQVRLLARGCEQTVRSDVDVYGGTPKLTTLRGPLTNAAIHRNTVAFGDCHSAFHQSPMPIESEPVHVEPAPEAQLYPSTVWLCKRAIQGLNFFWPYSQHTENQRHVLRPCDIRSFDVREEIYTTIR